jgi:hypothetical protein
MTRRRDFIIKSTATATSLLLFEKLKAFPSLLSYIQKNLDEQDDELLKKLLLQANGAEAYKNLSFDENLAAYRTNFHSNFGERDASQNYTPRTVQDIKQPRPVTPDDLYRACNYKENPFVEDVFPKLNTLFQSAIIGVGVAGLAAYGTVTFPVILAELTLMGAGVLNAGLVEGMVEKMKKDNAELCRRTVETYYKASKEKKEVLQSEEVMSRSRIPFTATRPELERKLPEKHPVRTASARSSERVKRDELLTAIANDLNIYLTEWKKAADERRTARERQEFLNNLASVDSELSASLYIGKAIIQVFFNDSKLAEDFYKVSMAVKDAYISYVKYTMAQPAIGTMAFVASWVSAGLTILSLFSSGGEAQLWRSLFSQLKQLAELIINGFNAVLENQKAIIQQLNFLTETVIRNGKIEQTLLRRLNDRFEQLSNKVDLFEYNQSMNVVINANEQLNTLVSDRRFDLQKDEYRVQFNKYITDYVVHATETACVSGAISGYAVNTNGADLRGLVNKNVPFEYQLGLVPVAVSTLTTRLKHFTNTYPGKLPNPIEWNRGVDLYLQAHLIARPDSRYVINHLAKFIASGEQVRKFLAEFINKEFIKELAELQEALSVSVADVFADYFKQRLLAKNYHLSIAPYRKAVKLKFTPLDRNPFRPLEPGVRSPRQGTVSQRTARRRQRYNVMERAFAGNLLTTLVDELDNDDKFPEHQVYAIDGNIFDVFETARDFGIIKLTTSTWQSSYLSNISSFTVYTCEFIDGNFKGLTINFTYNKMSFGYSFPYSEGRSPYEGREYYYLSFEGTYWKTLNPKSWRAQAKEIMKNKDLGRDYFKLKKLDPDRDLLDYSLVEFLINEIAHKSEKIKLDIINDSALDTDFLYRGNIDKSNEINTVGYLVINQLTMLNYNASTSPYEDYRDVALGRRVYTHFLAYPPKYAFFEDLARIFSNILSQDFLNESTHSEKWAAYKKTFSDDNKDLSPVFKFVTDNLKAVCAEQRKALVNMEYDPAAVNYNIRNTLEVLRQLKEYLEKPQK